MDIRDLIIDNEIPTNEPVATTKKPRKAPAGPTWEIVLQDHCDAAIRRKTAKTSRLLVLLMSQNQFYIKDEKNDSITKLDATSLHNFMKGCTLEDTKFVPWCGCFDGSRGGAEHFCEIVGNKDLQWLALRGMHAIAYTNGYVSQDSPYRLSEKRKKYDNPLVRTVKKVVEEVVGAERATELSGEAYAVNATERRVKHALNGSYFDELQFFEGKFGLDWTRAYFREFLTAPFIGDNLPILAYYGNNLFEVTSFEPGRFIEYLLFESTRQGFGQVDGTRYNTSDVNDFIRMWGDTLRMQKQTRRKVYDKYPDELESMHRRLSFKVRLMAQEVNESAFAEHSKRLMEHAKHDAYYLIRPPFNKADMADEASQQSNCLASYVNAFANDRTDIYFLRASIEPDKSLVTVEVRDGRIRQAYAKCNRRPGEDELSWLAKWAEENGIEMVDADHQHPMNP